METGIVEKPDDKAGRFTFGQIQVALPVAAWLSVSAMSIFLLSLFMSLWFAIPLGLFAGSLLFLSWLGINNAFGNVEMNIASGILIVIVMVLVLPVGNTLRSMKINKPKHENLQIQNNYSFSIKVKILGDAIGDVPAHKTITFAETAGINGSSLDKITYEDPQGQVLGTLNKVQPNVNWEEVNAPKKRFVWSASVGP